MSPRAFMILAGLTGAGIIAAAVAVVIESRSAQDVQLYDEPMFPELVARANDVAKVTYRTTTDHGTVELKNGQWVFADRYDYPVPRSNVIGLVASVAGLRRFEPKTDDPTKYNRLTVEGVDAPGANSRELTLQDAAGKTLAALVIGRTSQTMIFDPLGGTYVRVPTDARSWLVRGTVALPPSALDWMNRQIVHVPGPDVTAIQVREADKLVLDVVKKIDDNGVSRYTLVQPEDKIQAADSAIKTLASAIVSLNFDDVKPAKLVTFPAGAREVTYTSTDGMVLKATVAPVDGVTWVKFDTSMQAGKQETERAKGIRDATVGWAFAVSSIKSQSFLRETPDLREPIPVAQAEGPIPGLPANLQGLPPELLQQLQRQGQLPGGAAPAPVIPGVNLQGLRPAPAGPGGP